MACELGFGRSFLNTLTPLRTLYNRDISVTGIENAKNKDNSKIEIVLQGQPLNFVGF